MHSFWTKIVGGLVVSLSTGPCWAHDAICQEGLSPVRPLFAWPPAPAEVTARLRERADDAALAPSVAAALRHVLDTTHPDFTARAILRPGALAPDAAIALRELLADAVSAIVDQDAQERWMAYLARDPSYVVRLTAARAFLTWPDQRRRDGYIEAPNLEPDEAWVRTLAAKTDLRRLSAPVRWRVIKRLADGLDHPDDQIATALKTFDDPELTHAWYADRLRGHLILRALREASRAPITPAEERRRRAQFTGRALARFGQPDTRLLIWNEVTKIAATPSNAAAFAREVLAWESAWTLIFREARDHAVGLEVDEAAQLASLRERTFDERDFELARDARRCTREHPPAPARPWRAADIAAFEARLR